MLMLKLVDKRTLRRVAGLLGACCMASVFAWWWMILVPKSDHPPSGPIDPPITLQEALRLDVASLAGEIGPRHIHGGDSLDRAATFIDRAFSDAGYKVTRQRFAVEGEPCTNLEVAIPGSTTPDEIVVIGAHYDTIATTPGADDNASGIAVMLALARAFHTRSVERTLRFVAFANEEPGFFETDAMGSVIYAQALHAKGEHVVAMLSIESVGYYDDAAGSQDYPFPVNLFYPDTGNFIAMVGNIASRDLVHDVVGAFRARSQLPSEAGALPEWMPGVGWSDHWAFWQIDVPAVMVTDTAPFRNPAYHRPTDTPDTLDYRRMALLVDGLVAVIDTLTSTAGLPQ